MNIKTLALGIAAASMASSAQALIDINAFGGFTTVAMGDVNTVSEKQEASYKASGYTDVSTSKFANGYYVGADLGLSVLPFLKVGPRVEMVQASGSQSYTNSGIKVKSNSDLVLVPMMLGLSADVGIPLSGFSVKGGVWGGYAVAKSLNTWESSGARIGTTGSGGGFVAEVGGSARYGLPFIPFLSIGLDLGYRMANITEMKDDVTGAVYKKYGSTTDALPFDYSGLNVGGTLNFNF